MAPEAESPWSMPPDGGRRILVVEDEPKLRGMLARAIREMDFSVIEAATAEAGIEALEPAGADIALCDLSLPGMDGLELCRRIRERWPWMQLIILTGHGDLDAARRAIHLDVVEFLTKPCPLTEIEQALDRAVRRRRHGIIAQAVADPGFDGEATDPEPAAIPDLGALPRRLEAVERDHILEALARHDGNRTRAAADLGISVRTLYYRLKNYEVQGWIQRSDDPDG